MSIVVNRIRNMIYLVLKKKERKKRLLSKIAAYDLISNNPSGRIVYSFDLMSTSGNDILTLEITFNFTTFTENTPYGGR